MSREDVLVEVARRLCARRVDHPLRVGIDGICGVGKTTFAAELAEHIGQQGRTAVHLDSDGFHHVRAIRYRQGADCARGYYEDAYDFDSLRDLALIPLGPGGSRRYATRVHDLRTDEQVRHWGTASADAVVLFAATFIQRDSLRQHWDKVIYLDANLDQAAARGIARDATALGGVEAAAAAYEQRYLAACRIYLAEQNPRARASLVVDHDDPARPALVSALSACGASAQDER